ncbi:FAD-dependent oxidoreductase, partial [bacterium]|nr:FAD-dependent oxidoreductase [bacterium]
MKKDFYFLTQSRLSKIVHRGTLMENSSHPTGGKPGSLIMMLKRKNCIFVFILAVVASFVFLPAQAAAQDVIWLEAESFDSIGGWVNDPQFVDIMGSPYLLANGVDQAVEDAVTKITIPEQATYRLWVRTKDWLPSDSPGQFQVFINDTRSAEIFGKSDTADWQWIDGGAFELPAGEAEIRLHDLTGWWGRCDAVVLSADPDFQPSNVVSFLESQRVHYFDPYRDVKPMPSYDVVVVGGGLAGSAAAVEAARQGLSVALIQDRPVLGGNASSEIEVPPGGDNSNIPLDPKETGIIEEFYNVPGRGWEHDWSPAIEKVVRGEENLDLYLNTRAIDAVMKDEQTIKAVIALDVQENQRLLFPGAMFIDCTGDGWLGFWAGAQFRVGREARSEFNETLAPDKNDLKTMGNTLFVAGFKEGDSTPFECPDWAYTQWKSREDFESAGTHFSLERSMFPLPADAREISSRFTHGSGLAGTQYAT